MTEVKKCLLDRIESHRDDLIALCSRLIRMPSENPPGDTGEVAAFLRDYLAEKGIRCRTVGPDEKRVSVIGEIGSGSPRLIFNGHIDVVPAGDRRRWDFDPFSGEVRNGMILGRGSSDMKCGVAGMAFAAGLIAEAADRLSGKLVLSFVADEETGGGLGTRWLLDSGELKGDACLIGEPTLVGNATIGQKGALWLRLKARGTPAHGSLSPFVGDNAIMKLVSVLSRISEVMRLRAEVPAEILPIMEGSKAFARRVISVPGAEGALDHTTVNVGTIRGGDKANIVADWAEAEVDLRVPIGLTTARVLEKVADIIRESGGGVEYEALWRSEPNYTAPESGLVVALGENVSLVTGKPLATTFQWASSDARLFRLAGIPTAQYGPAKLDGIHSYNEMVSADDVVACAKVYAGVALDLLGAGRAAEGRD